MKTLSKPTKDLIFQNIPNNAKESIETQHGRLKEISIHFEEPLDLDEILSALSQAIEAGNITEDEIMELHLECVIPRKRLDRQQAQFHMSCLAYIQAKKLIESGDEAAAWPLLCHTSYLIGQTETWLAESNDARWTSENALLGRQLGGKVTNEKYAPFRTRMVELLKSRAPEGGWKTKKQAVETIYLELEKFIPEDPNSNVQIEDFHQAATNWLKKSGVTEINEAYQAHSYKAK
ncbi:hypothetical protein [Pseudomonas sp. St316]|uniref:hypothetical protein n=1 Tax=Pseudomonas sp. St316 TaxID=2678257 RepID=UPI001BB357AF|nr:hypothetical protein [Pseudomonas sp. St316]BBP57099.1 hypothetical protein PHLH4_06890 [Pseudomonas sp. St316]